MLPIIRTFAVADFEAVKALWQASGEGIQLRRSDTWPEIRKKLQRDPDLFLVAEIEGEIAGAVMGGFDGRRGFVYHLATYPAQRGLGIGSALMEELEARLRAKGCLKAYLLVTNGNQLASEYYTKRGWSDMTVAVHIFGKELQ